MISLDTNIWLLAYPLKVAGFEMGRKVVVVRLTSGKVAILSTGPFTANDIMEIKAVGQPGWLVDAMLRHDTYAKEGRAAFPGIPYLAPEGFSENVDFDVRPIFPLPPEWGDELQAMELLSVPSMRETVFFHRPSRTLIVQDLAFNFPGQEKLWSEFMLRLAVGSDHHPGMPRTFALTVKDRATFSSSLQALLAWDFDRVIVGHGEPIERDGKVILEAMFKAAGYL